MRFGRRSVCPKLGEVLQDKVIDGKFRLGRYLGGTGHSAVFLSARPDGKPAAIKLIPLDPAGADPQLTRWRLLSHLSHPHLLQIFESGRCEQDGKELLYVVMEFAEENLAQILSSRSLTTQEMDELLKSMLQALAYLHKHGFVHGRLKPADILVAGEQLKLSIDGIYRTGDKSDTEAGMYAPPEPSGTAMAPARDVWSLGVIVVQALTQLLPVREGSERQAVTLPETLPPRFADLAQNCLEREPQRRCTVAEIAEHLHYDLTPAPAPVAKIPVAAAPIAAAETPTPDRTRARAKDPEGNRFLWPAVAFVLTVLAVLGGMKLLTRQSPQAAVEQAKPAVPASALIEQPVPQPPKGISRQVPVPAPAKSNSPARATLKTASESRNIAPSSLPASGTAPASGAVPGQILQQALPDVPRGASNTIRGTVRVTVRVRVDPAGNVSAVSFVSSGPSAYFARKASDAARQWKFSPAHRDGLAVPSAWDLRFEFIRGATHVDPVAVP